MIALYLCIIISFAFLIAILILSKDIKDVLFAAFFTVLISVSIMLISKHNKPTAIDVYRDKTTLKISYIDSIPQDTVVVFKEEFK